MKRLLIGITLLSSMLFCLNTVAQIGIGTTSPHPSSILEVKSSTKGFLPPRLNSEQRDKIASTPEGLMIYNTDYNCLEFYRGLHWFNPCCAEIVESDIYSLPIETYFNVLQTTQIEEINGVTGLSSGNPADNGDFVFSLESNINGVVDHMIYTPGMEEPTNIGSHNIFKLTEEIGVHLPSYKYKRTLSRENIAFESTNGVSSLQHVYNPTFQQEYEVFITARIDSATENRIANGSFFSSSDNPNTDHSIQLGLGPTIDKPDFISGINCTSNDFVLRYQEGIGNRVICGTDEDSKVYVFDNQYHTFNIKCENHPTNSNKILSLFIDGNFIQSDSTLTDFILFEKLKLFSNRNGNTAIRASISELFLFTSTLNESQKSLLDKYLLCKYGR